MSESSRRRTFFCLLAVTSCEFVESAGLERTSFAGRGLASLHSSPEEDPAGVTDRLGSVQPAAVSIIVYYEKYESVLLTCSR